jgi:plasmid stabilization system protein ParE
MTPRAQRDLVDIFGHSGAEMSDAARVWYLGLRDFRHLLYGRRPHIYRVIFRIVEKQKLVEVLHIRHGAQRSSRRPTSLKTVCSANRHPPAAPNAVEVTIQRQRDRGCVRSSFSAAREKLCSPATVMKTRRVFSFVLQSAIACVTSVLTNSR